MNNHPTRLTSDEFEFLAKWLLRLMADPTSINFMDFIDEVARFKGNENGLAWYPKEGGLRLVRQQQAEKDKEGEK